MNGYGDSNADFDAGRKGTDNGAEMEKMSENLKACMSRFKGQREYKADMLTNAQMTFKFLEHQSLVDFVEMDNEYIVSTGRDHDINVWDAVTGSHIRRLPGHVGPVTGLHIHSTSEPIVDRLVVTSSEDGTIRQWSLKTGDELRRFETDAVITCMGVLNDALAVTGNHKGYMEVRHLLTGELYSTIMAHMDPIEIIVVKDNFTCTATFDTPCLKVWEIHLEQITCIYRIDDVPAIQFATLAIWKTKVFLGDSTEPKIHVIDFKTSAKGVVVLERAAGNVQNVRVVNGWILSCSARKKDVVLDVHRADNYEHFGTFPCKMKQVYAVAAQESDISLKIALGGSALAVINFEFLLQLNRYNRCTEKSKFTEKNGEADYKPMSTEKDKCPAEGSTDSSDDSTEYSKIVNKPFTNFLGIALNRTSSGDLLTMDHNATDRNAEKVKGSKIIYGKMAETPHETKVFQSTQFKTILDNDEMRKKCYDFSQVQPQQVKTMVHGEDKSSEESIKKQCEKICHTYKDEPRVILKKLDKLLDDKAARESVNYTNKNNENCDKMEEHDTKTQRVDIYANMFKNLDGRMSKEINEENDMITKQGLNVIKTVKESEQSDNEVEHAEGANHQNAITDEGKELQKGKSKTKKGKKSKSNKTPCKNKHKCAKCQIM